MDSSKSRVIPSIGIAFFIIWILLAAYLFSDAGVSFTSLLIAFVFVVIWLIVWSIRLIPSFQRYKIFHSIYHSSVVLWKLEPIGIFLIAMLAYTDTLMLARLYVSAPALERYVSEVQEGKVDLNFEFNHPTRRVGWFFISRTDAMPNGEVRFITSGDKLFDSAGFSYYQNGEPPAKEKNSYTHIFGPWWQWKQHF